MVKKIRRALLKKTFCYCLLALAPHILAEDSDTLPLWEVGVGAAGLDLPQYVGSDERTTGVLPIPYFAYRGESVKISRESLSGRLFKRADLVLDLSAEASLPVKSDNNDARTGMDDIDFVMEVGPALRYIFLRDTPQHRTVSIELPVRAVFQSNLRYIDYEGWRINPRLRWREHFGPYHLSVWAGAYWNDRRYNQLYYGVEEDNATALRPAYETSDGYGGWAASSSLSYRQGDWWVGGFIRWFDIRHANFSDSPLAVKDTNLGFGLAFAWLFKSSPDRVPRWE